MDNLCALIISKASATMKNNCDDKEQIAVFDWLISAHVLNFVYEHKQLKLFFAVNT